MPWRCDVLIVVPLAEEFRTFTKVWKRKGPVFNTDGLFFYKMSPQGDTDNVLAIPLGKQGNVVAAQLVQNILGHVDPKVIVLVGIGGETPLPS